MFAFVPRAAKGLKAAAMRYGRKLEQRSRAVAPWLERNAVALSLCWIAGMTVIGVLRIRWAEGAVTDAGDMAQLVIPYALIVVAPLLGVWIAAAAYPGNHRSEQPGIRLALFGRWRRIKPAEARRDPAFGPAGFIASLMIGLMVNVAMRAVEFGLGIPAITSHAPAWATYLFRMMALDMAVMGFIYMVCLVAALRSAPLFPRLLLFAWLTDLLLQISIASRLASFGDLPQQVALPLSDLLVGNVYKVLISMAVWLPYLLLSQRVNVTFRLRKAA